MAFVEGCPEASIFHHPAWLALLRDQYGYEIEAWCLVEGAQRLVAGLPVARINSRLTGRRLVALPFSDSCSPLFAPGRSSLDTDFAQALDEERRRRRLALEVRAQLPAQPASVISERFHHHRLALQPDIAAVESRFSKSRVRGPLAQAIRLGLTVERRQDVAALDTFYALHL